MSCVRAVPRIAGFLLIAFIAAPAPPPPPPATPPPPAPRGPPAGRAAPPAGAAAPPRAPAPWYAHHRANVEAAAERAAYEGQLPDPQLSLGLLNVPTDTWKLDREDTTMAMVGVRQSFPPYGALDARTRRAQHTVTPQ